MGLIVENILDLIEINGEDETRRVLSVFSCPDNPEIEGFIKNKAIDFAKQKLSVTYTVSDIEDSNILGYFTLAIKAIEISSRSVSKSMLRKISKYALFDEINNKYTAAAFLLAQFGKNYGVDDGKRISGQLLMYYAEETVRRIQHMIGVGLIYLDVEKNNTKAINLYINNNKYIKFNERKSKVDSIEYNVLIKSI